MNAGLSMNGIVGMMLMHPIEWHKKGAKNCREMNRRQDFGPEEIKELIGRHKRHSIADNFYTLRYTNRSNSLGSFKDIKDKDSQAIVQLSKVMFIMLVRAIASSFNVSKGIWIIDFQDGNEFPAFQESGALSFHQTFALDFFHTEFGQFANAHH